VRPRVSAGGTLCATSDRYTGSPVPPMSQAFRAEARRHEILLGRLQAVRLSGSFTLLDRPAPCAACPAMRAARHAEAHWRAGVFALHSVTTLAGHGSFSDWQNRTELRVGKSPLRSIGAYGTVCAINALIQV
jgi:hypothetical protein